MQAVDALQAETSYLAQATEILPSTDDWQDQASATRDELLLAIRKYGRGETGKGVLQSFAARIADLRKQYVERYAQAHQLAVLGPAEDDRRKKLLDDPRRRAMKELEKLELLAKNRTELEGWQQALANQRSCLGFHIGMLENSPKCESCNFVPSKQPTSATARAILDNLDDRLDAFFASWQQAVRDGLGSDTAKLSLANMTAEERKPVEAFLSQAPEYTSIPAGLVKAAGSALHGITALAVEPDQLLAALRSGGMPCTVEQLEQRFAAFVGETMRNHDRRTTRIAIPTAGGQ